MATENLEMAETQDVVAGFAADAGAPGEEAAAPHASDAAPRFGGDALRRRLNMPNFVLVGLFLAGVGCLYAMSLHVGPRKASANETSAEAKVDAALTQLTTAPRTAELQKETRGIVDTFYYEARQRQVPLDKLTGNPFAFEAAVDTSRLPAQDDAAPAAPVPQGAAEAMAAAAQLKLQSVLRGTHGATAMISNNLLSEGQVINGWTVQSIEPRQVTLTWNDQQYVLKMPR